MNTKKPNRAFSLIELSIVILVIGILVLGITKGSRILSDVRIKTARSLTVNSPVNLYGNVAIWLESTSEKSFDADVGEGSTIQNWHNIDPTDLSGKKATQATAANRPTYTKKGINGLPAVKFTPISDSFAAGSDCMSIPDGFDGDAENVTIFAVWFKASPSGSYQFILEKWNDGSEPYPYVVRSVGNSRSMAAYDMTNNPNVNDPAFNSDGANLFSGRRVKNGLMQMWMNGVQKGGNITDNTVGSTTNAANLYVGCRHFNNVFMDGYIGELIIFNRNLKDSERVEVEKYLAQKWRIKLS